MSETLNQIIQEAALAANREEALNLVLGWVADNLHAHRCVLYLKSADTGDLEAVSCKGETCDRVSAVGLVQLVAEHREPLRLIDPWRHPRYAGPTVSPRDRFDAYLAVPIMHSRKVLGVLEAQRRGQQHFGDADTALLLTLSAQMAQLVTGSETAGGGLSRVQKLFKGTPAAPGVAIGLAVSPSPLADLGAVPDRPPRSVEDEIRAFEDAILAAQAELHSSSLKLAAHLPDEIQILHDVYTMVLSDHMLNEGVIGRIRAGQWAPAALRDTIAALAARFEAISDSYLRARAEDVRAVGRRLLLHLQSDRYEPEAFPEHSVLVGKEVALARMTTVPPERLGGFASSGGSVLSHSVIVARALGIAAVVGVEDFPWEQANGRHIIVDGYRGRVILDPRPDVCAHFERLQREEAALSSDLRAVRNLPAQTPDGRRLALEANVALLNEIPSVKDQGADGVGLYRTEFPFILRETFPGEDEQYAVYRELLEAFAPRPVTMRTLDAGGDKPLPYLPLEETNPALGRRGIRLSLDHPEIFLVQLRAMLRANRGLGNLRLMLPMVTHPKEVEETRDLVGQAYNSLRDEGIASEIPPIGIMVEVPAAVLQADRLATVADFFSIGTNDLAQYLLAADRTNAQVSALYDPLCPAVLEGVRIAAEAAQRHGIGLSVCGEMAGDPLGALLLLGLGVDALSMTARSIPRIKQMIRGLSNQRAGELWRAALQQDSAHKVRSLLTDVLEQEGLGSMVRPGR